MKAPDESFTFFFSGVKFKEEVKSSVIRSKNLPLMSPLNFWNFVPSKVLQIFLILCWLAWPFLTILKIEFHLIVNVLLLFYISYVLVYHKSTIFYKKTMVNFYRFVIFLKLGLKPGDFWAQVVQAKYLVDILQTLAKKTPLW